MKDYIEKLLKLYGMEDCNVVTLPIDVNVKMENHKDSQSCDIEEYQELMGRLMYLSVHGRPDIAYAVSCLSQFNNNPKNLHLTALKKILRYLKGTINHRLKFGNRSQEGELICETDVSWNSTKDAKSFTRILFYRNGDLIHWKCRKQTRVALSLTESKLEAMLEEVKEVVWCKNLLNEIGLNKGLRIV